MKKVEEFTVSADDEPGGFVEYYGLGTVAGWDLTAGGGGDSPWDAACAALDSIRPQLRECDADRISEDIERLSQECAVDPEEEVRAMIGIRWKS